MNFIDFLILFGVLLFCFVAIKVQLFGRGKCRKCRYHKNKEDCEVEKFCK